ncbi:MARVEL domain-containing protein 3 [Brienomyrus brachyistius]|uniref:MARVEL domain-containing protein 3 n=1 Tax=Brienomyrus brachyistius TaxID=42636 RepID=UPI0020B4311C|nr:MARVEL domain-containing protein 3 [Brienomyrus brachyistius]
MPVEHYEREACPPWDGERAPERCRHGRHSDSERSTYVDRRKDPIVPSGRDSSYQTRQNSYKMEMDRYETESRQALYNLRYFCTSRAICQVMECFLNMLIVICAGVSYNASGVYKDLASLGGIYAYYYGGANAFTGADADRIKQLDQQFYQLKLPTSVNTMACGGALMGYACIMLVLGIFRMPFRYPVVLLVEALLNSLISLGYIPAVAFYFIKLQEVYATDVCKQRAQMYQSKGYQGFDCQLQGADICGGLFGAVGVIAFAFGAVLAVRAFIAVRKRKYTAPDDLRI